MKKIGIIGAMEEEVAKLKENMQIQGTSVIAGMEFCQGICEGQRLHRYPHIYIQDLHAADKQAGA